MASRSACSQYAWIAPEVNRVVKDPTGEFFPWYADTMAPQDFDAVVKSGVQLSSELDDPEAVPYFLWDEPMTVAELRDRLLQGSVPERTRLLAKILREARDTEVWRFTTPAAVARDWKALSLHLGRRRAFWEFLLNSWAAQGRLSIDWAR